MWKFGLIALGMAAPLVLAQSATPSLRSLASARGLYVGAAAMPNFYDPAEPEYPQVLAREFNMIVAENIMKWSALSTTRGKYSFAAADALVAFAQKNTMAVRGHALVWHESLPSYVFQITDRTLMQNVLRQQVQTVAAHFRGKVVAWDVLNEAILEDGSYRKTPFYKAMGEDFIGYLFKWAHEADPDAKLFYNDYNTESINPKSDAVYEMVKNLKAKGYPIDGVGFQTHIDSTFSAQNAQMQKNLQRFRDLGLEVQLTEIDVQLKGKDQAQRLADQARVYKELMQTCLAIKCSAFLTWGFTDAYSWRAAAQPLIFNSSYEPKPAYFALLEALGNPVAPPATTQTTPATPTVLAATAPAEAPLGFASFADNALLGGGQIQKTEYSERPGDAVIQSLQVVNNLLTVNYQLSKAAGSSYAGVGINISYDKPFNASQYTVLRVQVASSQAETLRFRVAGNDTTTLQAGCYPIFYQKVTPSLTTYDLLLKQFAAPGYCAARGKSVEETLSALSMIEIADEGLPNSGTRNGQIQLRSIELR